MNRIMAARKCSLRFTRFRLDLSDGCRARRRSIIHRASAPARLSPYQGSANIGALSLSLSPAFLVFGEAIPFHMGSLFSLLN
jgi:hypothetical protein